jgi:hypothetical protein
MDAMSSELRAAVAADGGRLLSDHAGEPTGLPRLLPARPEGGPATLGDHLARHGPLPGCALGQ